MGTTKYVLTQFNTVQPFKHSFQLGELQENQKQERRHESRLTTMTIMMPAKRS